MNQLLGEYYEEAVMGQPPKLTRLMAGLLYLKHTFALSDEELIARWVENASRTSMDVYLYQRAA